MSSDADYSSFLDKANQSTGSAASKSASMSKSEGLSTKSVEISNVPEALSDGIDDIYYVSDADEPFQTVGLHWSGDKLDEESFKSAIGASGSVSKITVKQFDPKGDYSQVVEKVKSVTHGDVSVFRVEGGGTRIEYFVVGISEDKKNLLGLKAKAVES